MYAPLFALVDDATIPAADSVRGLVELVVQYGPFAFAILFIFYVSRWSYTQYDAAVTKKLPAREINTHRAVFVGACLAALALVVVSIGYWFYSPPLIHVYRGRIVNLSDYERLGSQQLFRMEERHQVIDPLAPPQRDESFLVVRSRAFSDHDSFQVDFSKGDGHVDSLTLPYSKDDDPRFVIQFDEASKSNVIKRVQAPASRDKKADAGSWLVPVAYAAEPEQAAAARPSAAAMKSSMNLIGAASIQTLQNPRSTVGAKIAALEPMLNASIGKDVLTKNNGVEPLAVTLIDLARHTDKELAYLARSAAQHAAVDEAVREVLSSSSADERRTAESIVFRMDVAEATAIVKSLPADARNAELIRRVESGRESVNLRPTGSSQGDRYYVQATWQPESAAVSQCLSKVFNDQLNSDRTLQQENNLMANRGMRLVYWYDKQWAITMARQITQCGAASAFVTPRLAS
jgi:hypothetical protein